jgi:hypothetical protein
MAERRTRPTSADRRLIADRSAKSLRLLATPLRIYRDRSGGNGAPARRSVNLTEYLTSPSYEMDVEEDDDEFENVLGSAASAVEGARVNTEMYDAFGGSSQRWSSHPSLAVMRRTPAGHSTAVASAGSDDTQVMHDSPTTSSRSPTFTNRSGPWTLPSTSSLFRHSSVRRPVRSRTVDFNEFTARRRPSIRPSSAQDVPSLRTGAASDDPGRPISPWDPASVQEPPARPSPSARRFFGLSRIRRHEANGTFLVSVATEPSAGIPDEMPSYLAIEPSVAGPWVTSPPSPSSSSHYQTNEPGNGEDRAQEAVPRLRRGGLRAPESMLSRHASPTLEEDTNTPPLNMIPLSTSSTSEDVHITVQNASGAIESQSPIPT